MLKIGDRAPDFELPDDHGRAVRLRELLEAGPIILYFYPADFTLFCVQEACMFRRAFPDLEGCGLRVFGVSPQEAESHARFRERFRIPYPLLVDRDKKVIRAYGADGPFGLGVRRITYLIGADGTVTDRLRADFIVGRHRAFVRRALSRLETSAKPAGSGATQDASGGDSRDEETTG